MSGKALGGEVLGGEVKSAPGSPIEAVDRALRVVEFLATVGPGGSALAELSASLELSKATAHRVLGALRYREFVSQAPDGNYVLGPRATRLGSQFYRDENLPEMLRPTLAQLSEALGELVHLGVLRGRHVVYLDKVEPQRAVRVWSAIGRGTPVLGTALGRALLAAGGVGRDVVARYAPEDSELVDRAWDAIERGRAAGYAIEREENEPGISCLAVALVRGGAGVGGAGVGGIAPTSTAAPVAAISITAPSERLRVEDEARIHAEILRILPDALGPGLKVFRA